MTHENPHLSYTEHRDGPEHDASLPDATSIPVYDDPASADAPPLDGDLED